MTADQPPPTESGRLETGTPGIDIAALILAIVVPVVGLALALVARSQARSRGERAGRIASAALVVSSILTGLALLSGIVFLMVVFAPGGEQWWGLMPVFLEGFRMTLVLLVLSGLGALILGTLIAAMRISPVPALRVFATVYTEIARNTPLTLVFYFTIFVMPMMGVRVDFFPLALLALTFYTSPFVAEALRSGINGVPVGQAEAARSIGMGFGQTVSLIVLPQAFRMTVPPLINVFIALTKNTSVAGGFFIMELFGVAKQLANQNGNMVIPILVTVAGFYLVITFSMGFAAGKLEKKWLVLR